MIRILFSTCIFLVFNLISYAQTDSSLKKNNDSLVMIEGIQDTLQKNKENLVDAGSSARSNIVSLPAGNEPVYKLNPAIDIPVAGVAAGWSIFAFPKIYDKDASTEAAILNLNKNNINGFDRWAADVYHAKADKNSDYFLCSDTTSSHFND